MFVHFGAYPVITIISRTEHCGTALNHSSQLKFKSIQSLIDIITSSCLYLPIISLNHDKRLLVWRVTISFTFGGNCQSEITSTLIVSRWVSTKHKSTIKSFKAISSSYFYFTVNKCVNFTILVEGVTRTIISIISTSCDSVISVLM